MKKIIEGVRRFQSSVYPDKQALFHSLARQQFAKVLFITCSDSRVDASLITQTDPGDMFMIQNVGNIIPPHGALYGGTGAGIDYAVSVLGVKDIIVCGHSQCGAMTALLTDTGKDISSSLQQWLSYAETSKILSQNKNHDQCCPPLTESDSAPKHKELLQDQLLLCCIQSNVQVQLTHLKTYPNVATQLDKQNLALHGWVYHIETGEIDVFDEASQQFVTFDQAYSSQVHCAEVSCCSK